MLQYSSAILIDKLGSLDIMGAHAECPFSYTSVSYSAVLFEKFHGVRNWGPTMPREGSVSYICASDRCSLSI